MRFPSGLGILLPAAGNAIASGWQSFYQRLAIGLPRGLAKLFCAAAPKSVGRGPPLFAAQGVVAAQALEGLGTGFERLAVAARVVAAQGGVAQ